MFSSSILKNKGFTLVELLVTISIMGILLGILIFNFPKGKQQLALQRSAHKILQDLKAVQESSMSAKAEECPGEVNARGFGAYFDQSSPNSYILFADCDNSHTYNYGDKNLKSPQVDLEKGIKISSLSPNSPLSVVFSPPSPTTYINGYTIYDAQLTISLESDVSKTKTIKINKAGLIEIE